MLISTVTILADCYILWGKCVCTELQRAEDNENFGISCSESDRGDQQDHESVCGVKASTIWRNQNKLQYFWKGKAGKHSFTWATWTAADGKILRGEKLKGGKLSLIVLGSPPGSWENSAETVPQWQQLPSCPKHTFWKCALSQWSNVQRHEGPDSVDQ